MSQDPAGEYQDRRSDRQETCARRADQERLLSNLRLVTFGSIVVFCWLIFAQETIGLTWLALPVSVFLLLLVVHDRVIRAHQQAERALAFYERGLARIEQRFAGTGTAGDGFRDAQHPYADDLDLFGRGSVFELLCTARTRAGEETLAAWLGSAAAPDEVFARQQAVEELRPRLDLREELALLGGDVRAGLHPEALRGWGGAAAIPLPGWHRLLAPALASLSVAGLALWFATPAGPIPFLFMLGIQGSYALGIRTRVSGILQAVDAPARDLDLFARLLSRLEKEGFAAPRLAALQGALETDGLPPSQQISKLHRLVELADARRNQLFAPIGGMLLWGTQFALAIEDWRQRCGPALERWIESVGEFEALVSMASFAFEHPHYPFPSLEAEAGLFDAQALGHPLIPAAQCVRNDVRLGGALRSLVISGSNMSGKSTLLRSVGVNAVLALAGAPVCAGRLRLSPLSVGASIQVMDSLQDGESHFYAEIKRVKQVMELAQQGRHALFLLDEIFHGTNSHDRGIGAEAVLRALIDRGAIGLVTTHDLALARVAEGLAPQAANVHFEDHLEDGRIAFDYRMREGVVRKSNALELMRSVGLPV